MTMAASGLLRRGPSELPHGGNIGVQLRGIFTGRPDKELRRVYGRQAATIFPMSFTSFSSMRILIVRT